MIMSNTFNSSTQFVFHDPDVARLHHIVELVFIILESSKQRLKGGGMIRKGGDPQTLPIHKATPIHLPPIM